MDKLLTPEQVAELLQVEVKCLYQWTSKGIIPYIKIGGGKFLRFSQADITEWIESNKQNNASNTADTFIKRLNKK